MRRLTSFNTNRILHALCQGNKKPLQKLIRKLLADNIHRYWADEEILLLKAIELFCLEHGYVQDAQDLIRITGFDKLLELPESAFQIAVCLVEYGDETFIKEAFAAIEQSAVPDRLPEAKSKLLLSAAEKALALGRNGVALHIYRAALAYNAQLDIVGKHPLVIAAKSNNRILAQAYLEIYHKELRYVRYESGYLEALVLHGDPHFIQLALEECKANVHTPTSTGQSLLDIAPNKEIRSLLVEYGAQPTNHQVYLLRQAILSIENGEVNHNVMQELFSAPDPLVQYFFYESTHPTVSTIKYDLIFTAAKHRCIPALTYIAAYLQNKYDDKLLEQMLKALLDIDTFVTVTRNSKTAKEIIAVLELLDSYNICLVNPWDLDDEVYRMITGYSSKTGRMLNSVCHRLSGDSDYPDDAFAKIAALLWKIGGVANTANGARDLMLIGLYHRKMCLLKHVLTDLGYDFSLLDTDRTTAAWNAVANHECENVAVTKEYLQFVIQNGGDLNHQTVDGLTALHAAYQYNDKTSRKLLIAFGADQSITDRFGRRPKEMPKEKFEILPGGFIRSIRGD